MACDCNPEKAMMDGRIRPDYVMGDMAAPAPVEEIATPASRLDEIDAQAKERHARALEQMESLGNMNFREHNDIWSRLSRIEAVLGLPPIADSAKGQW